MNLREVKRTIEEERQMYVPHQYTLMKWSHQKRYLIWKTLSAFRMAQYWKTEMSSENAGLLKRIHAKIAYHYYLRQRNIYSEKSGVEIASHSLLGKRLDIWHSGVVISGRLGDDCVIHGNNVIGNKGSRGSGSPVLGNGVDLGVGAMVIGNIRIADGCKIGANAVVTRNFEEENCLIVGIPAHVKGKY